MARRIACVIAVSAAAVVVLDSVGCANSNPVLPTAPAAAVVPAPAAPPPPLSVANWQANATVVSVTTNPRACGWGTTTGETRSGVEWRITIADGKVSLDEDMRNSPTDDVPFAGTVSGQRFTASYSEGPDYLKWVCQFKGGSLSGTFSPDFSSFDAEETMVWGPPEQETVVVRHWSGHAL